MVFTAPDWVPGLAADLPGDITIEQFMFDEKYGRHSLKDSRPPYTCGITGASYSAQDVRMRVDQLARGLAKAMKWSPNEDTEWDKVIGIFSVNTIDTLPLAWATHRLGGIVSPANAAYSAAELTYQLKSSKAKALFTCIPLLSIALEAAVSSGIPKRRIYLLDVPKQIVQGPSVGSGFETLDQLIVIGQKQPALAPLRWSKDQGKRQCAYLCYSSGTSGLPKGVIISHANVIANVLQMEAFERPSYSKSKPQISLGLLPQSHIYSIIVISHLSTYRGAEVINLPKFDFQMFLNAIQRFKITALYVVPPIIVAMINNKTILDKYDLSSVETLFTGAAPLGAETANELLSQHPNWQIKQGYGLTESCTVISTTSSHDIWFGSSGSLLPHVEAKIMCPEGKEITEYDTPGELVVRSPSITLGYLNNEKATRETYQGGWMRTGDEVVIRKSKNGTEHVFIVDRIKELIKVKAHQVAPAELEAFLLTLPSVSDAAVIPVPNEEAGEVPKAYVVKSASSSSRKDDDVVREINQAVEKEKAKYKWLVGGVEFIDVIPKSPSGKILRRMLRDKEKDKRRANGAKL